MSFEDGLVLSHPFLSGRGSKICDSASWETMSQPHSAATRDLLRARLSNDRKERLEFASPERDVFLKTAAYVTAIRKLGCSSPAHEVTNRTPYEQLEKDRVDEQNTHTQRGYVPKSDNNCQGRLEFEYTQAGDPCIR